MCVYRSNCILLLNSEFAKFNHRLLISGGNDGHITTWTCDEQGEAILCSRFAANPFIKINWLTTVNDALINNACGNVFVAGITASIEHSQGPIAVYQLH
jgi:hypothetical protein